MYVHTYQSVANNFGISLEKTRILNLWQRVTLKKTIGKKRKSCKDLKITVKQKDQHDSKKNHVILYR